MPLQVCPFHAHEDVKGVPGDQPGAYVFTCTAKGHPAGGEFSWPSYPDPPAGLLGSGLTGELGLGTVLPALVATFPGTWIEYGVLEQAYATTHPEDFALLVETYGHTAIAKKKYSVSAFIARALGDLARAGAVLYHDGPATGRWSYNSNISWWAVTPTPSWEQRVSWESTGLGMSYVPGSNEP